METVDTKQLDDQMKELVIFIEATQSILKTKKNLLEKLLERKKSIELYNKKP